MMKTAVASLLAITLVFSFWGNAVGQDSANLLIVSPQGPYTTIEAALNEAKQGDTVEVRGGIYHTSLVVNKSVTLNGVGNPIIDGSGTGTVVKLAAPQIVFRGFDIRNSGSEPDFDHSGIIIQSNGITVENNRLYETLFGIFVERANNATVRNNDITSKTEYETGRKGDGIRLWYSKDVVAEKNHLHESRDVVIWYSKNVIVRDNTIENGRYGVHLMYANNARIEKNLIHNNSVGLYTMYSSDVILRGNDIRGQRGPSGYALGFKDASNVEASENILVDNRGGVFLDNTPFEPKSYSLFIKNVIAFNDIGVVVMTAVHGNVFEGNSFWENIEQVGLQGGGLMDKNLWKNNYWSDYTGFDANNDGVGDVPYRSEHFFENLTDRTPILRALIYSPAAQTIEFAATSFPIFKPQPKFIDDAPAMQPTTIPASFLLNKKHTTEMIWLGLALVTLGAACGGLTFSNSNRKVRKENSFALRPGNSMTTTVSPLVQIQNVTKRYNKIAALDNVSLEVKAGESIALWGENGAGKTTLIKAILGLIDFQGNIIVNEHDAKKDGKAVRRSIGYVPQEAIFYDMSVQATMEFYANLKRTKIKDRRLSDKSLILNLQSPTERIPYLLEKLGLAEHAHKPVPALSGGLKQRLALAVALLADPPVLVFDEPTANLDVKARRDYLALLATLRKENKTLIFASHRVEEVEALADRVTLMESGRIVESLTPGEVRLKLSPHVELTLWVANGQRERALHSLEEKGITAHLNGRGTVVAQIDAEQKLNTFKILAEQGITITDFEIERGRLWN